MAVRAEMFAQETLSGEIIVDNFAVADSAYELARMIGVSVTSVLHATSCLRNPSRKSKYKLVWVPDDD